MSSEQLLENLLSLPDIAGPQVSPDKKWVAWSWYRIEATAQVYLVPTDGSTPPQRLTYVPENVGLVSWTPDSQAVIVAHDHEGDERLRLFRVELNQPGQMQPLTEASPQYFIRGGELHPNGKWLFYAANFDFANNKAIEPSWLYRHDLSTEERKVLARPEKAGWYRPQLNRQGTHLLYDRNDLHPAGNQVWLVDVEGENDREILNYGPEVKVNGSWMADGKRILVLAEAGTYRRAGIWEKGEVRWLIDDARRNLEGIFAPEGEAEDSNLVVIMEVKDTKVKASLLDVSNAKESDLPNVPGNLLPLAPLGEGQWLAQYYSAKQPTDIVRFSLQEEQLQPESFVSLTRLWERLKDKGISREQLIAAEDFRWQSVDNLEVQGWLFRTKTEPSRGTIIYIHGGPTAHIQDKFYGQVQFFASEGFNVLAPNYRGSTGFTLAYQESIKQDGWGGREQADMASGIEALIKAGIAQPSKVGVTGTSYGGYSSWFLITHYPTEIVAAAAPICGMTDLVVDYETTRPDLRPYSEEMLGGRPDQVPEKYRERSPIHFVNNIKGKLLIVQGLQDPNVTPHNVQVVREALEQANLEYELLIFEDEGHGIGRPKNQKILFKHLVDFFAWAFGD